MARILTPDQRRRLAEEGVVFPIRVLDPLEAERFRAECDALEVQLGGRPRTVDVRQMHLHFRWAYELASHPRVLDAVEDILGPDLVVWATELFSKHPHDGVVSIGWHRDGVYMGLDAERTVTAWIALTLSGRENGGMRVARESNRRQTMHSSGGHAAVSARRHADPPEDMVLDVELAAGEMSLHDVHVLHGSGANRSSQKRIGFAVRFTTPECHPLQHRPPALLVRGQDRYGHFELLDPPYDNDASRGIDGLRLSARQHLEATLDNLKHAAH